MREHPSLLSHCPKNGGNFNPLPDTSLFEEESKILFRNAVDECTDKFLVMQIKPYAWGRMFHLIDDPDADTILSIYMSDDMNKSRVRRVPGWEHHPEPIPRIHPCPELEARLAHATQRAAELRKQHECRMLPWTGGTATMPLE